MKQAEDVLRRHVERLMALPGVFGVAIGVDEERECIEVLAESLTAELQAEAPSELEGVPVRIREMGRPEVF